LEKGICEHCNKILKNLELGEILLFRTEMCNNRNIFIRIKSNNRRTRKNTNRGAQNHPFQRQSVFSKNQKEETRIYIYILSGVYGKWQPITRILGPNEWVY
jgi:hypothetical protein